MADSLLNQAFVFVKPHAVNDKVVELVKEKLKAAGLKVTGEGSISAEQIDEKSLIDTHYYAIASKATLLTPDKLNVPADKFKGQFGVEWADALKEGKCYNAMDGGKKLGLDATGLEKRWRQAKGEKKIIKFGGGFYCAELDGIYVFNGFFMSMRNKYVAKGKSIHWMTVEFAEATASWETFRTKILGPTDPSTGPRDSVRGVIYETWKELGLEAQPDTGDNSVHASASPFEGLAERMNWLGADMKTDAFGKAMLEGGITEEMIKAWSVDPQVTLEDKSKGSLFDALEDMNASACLAKAQTLAKLQ